MEVRMAAAVASWRTHPADEEAIETVRSDVV